MATESFLDILNQFEALKQRLDISSLTGLALFEAFKLKLGTPKTWKARDVLNLLDKRAKQKEFMNQVGTYRPSIVYGLYISNYICGTAYLA